MAAARLAFVAEPPGVEAVLALVRQHGGRVTPAKRLLVEVLLASHDHRSAEQLADQVRARAPDIHLTTVYRNLEELEKLGAVDRMHPGHGPATYHLAAAPHGHLVCLECGSITEVPSAVFGGLGKTIRREFGFEISTGQMALAGRCASCQQE